MKDFLKNTTLVIALVGFVVFSSCQKTDLVSFDRSFSGIYFQQDSVYYSFGVTKLEVQEYVWQVPLRVMGGPANEDREIAVRVEASESTAVEGVHYELPASVVVHADSVNAYIPVRILRGELGEADYKLTFTLQENEDFVPVNERFKSISLHFNNRVERPNWRDFRGNLTWPTSQLGPWNPTVYIKFIELFRELEQKSPVTYQNMVDEFGPDLANVEFGWPWDYNHTMIKYVLIPLYQYFVEENPELGITIPRPSNY